MRSILELGKVLVLLTVLIVLFNQSAYAQTARTLNNKLVTVRLCPATCKTVDGHGLKPGGNVTVLETRGGWVRVSPYLDRKTLVGAFGKKITKKPALWVAEANLASDKAKSTDSAKKEPKPAAKKKRPTVVEQVARLRRIPTPKFRPDGAVQRVAVTEEPKVEEAKVEEPIIEQVKTEEPKVEEVEAKPVVVDTKPVTSVAKGTAKKKALTWEEVQAKIAAQGGTKTERTVMKVEEPKVMKVEEPKAEAPKAEEVKVESKVEEPVKKVEKTETAAVEPTNTISESTSSAAEADPISFGARPKKLTKPLLDKRLSKLPGAKSKVKKEVVIALRHYALGLLNSGACKGIAGGGASASPGMLFVACSEDPTYLRQFPLEEQTW